MYVCTYVCRFVSGRGSASTQACTNQESHRADGEPVSREVVLFGTVAGQFDRDVDSCNRALRESDSMCVCRFSASFIRMCARHAQTC